MINILSYVGMSLQCELCLWTIIGLLTTIFDATLFKVDSNLKQVWQMEMPAELSMSMQRFLRTMISGVMLVQCFTLYVYLATYIVLLYPVFLTEFQLYYLTQEEKPALVLPWLLLAAVRKLLCELMSLALGLGVCVLLGAARTPCIRFLLLKTLSITPSFYLWMQVLDYYFSLKLAATTYKSFIKISASRDTNYGLEMAVRRRRTKSLQGEEDLRRKLVAKFYTEPLNDTISIPNLSEPLSNATSAADITKEKVDINKNSCIHAIHSIPSATSNKNIADDNDEIDFTGDWNIPRDADRIMEQIVLMMLKIGASLNQDIDPVSLVPKSKMPKSDPLNQRNLDCAALSDEVITPPIEVGNVRGSRASYITDYPQIFMKRSTERTLSLSSSELLPRAIHAQIESQTQAKYEFRGTHYKNKWRAQSSSLSNEFPSTVKEVNNQIENQHFNDFKYDTGVIESEITQLESNLMTNDCILNPVNLMKRLENAMENPITVPNNHSDRNDSLSSGSALKDNTSASSPSSSKNTAESEEVKSDEEIVQKKSVSFVKYFNQ